MAKQKIDFDAWGICEGYTVPTYAMGEVSWFEPASMYIGRAIARANRLSVVNIQADGYGVDDDGKVTYEVFQIALGKPAAGGGYNVHTSMWFQVNHGSEEA